MNEEYYEAEDGMIFCDDCGREYPDHLDVCPFCEAERKTKIITKYGSYKSRGATVAGLLLAVLLVAGAVLLLRGSILGGWSVGREYAVDVNDEVTVEAGTNQQQSSDMVTVAPEVTDTADSTEDPTAEDADEGEDAEAEESGSQEDSEEQDSEEEGA